MGDDVPDEEKSRRISEIIELQTRMANLKNQRLVGRTVEILVEGLSKKSADEWSGRTDGNKTVVFPKDGFKAGDYIRVAIDRANSATLFGHAAGSRVNPGPRLESTVGTARRCAP
jgi:tRNA-2-methylthio-N6-dimethylallyladenosine synthase